MFQRLQQDLLSFILTSLCEHPQDNTPVVHMPATASQLALSSCFCSRHVALLSSRPPLPYLRPHSTSAPSVSRPWDASRHPARPSLDCWTPKCPAATYGFIAPPVTAFTTRRCRNSPSQSCWRLRVPGASTGGQYTQRLFLNPTCNMCVC